MSEGFIQARGFQGLASLPLADMIQLEAVNRFSGLIAVTSAGHQGRLCFLDGRIVHAEAGGELGEAAVRRIIGWPEGSFELHPNITTLERTIDKSVSHLLLDAHCALDESRRSSPPQVLAMPSPPAAQPKTRTIDAVRSLPGVANAVTLRADGTPVGDRTPEAEELAARGLYLAVSYGAPIGSALALHDLAVASLHAPQGGLLLFHIQGSYLCISVAPGASNDEVETRVRALLARPAER